VNQQLTSFTKAIAVALDIAGRPDTDDAYALSSVRKAYRLLNGGTFQDLVSAFEDATPSVNYGMDWAEAYRLELEKNEALMSRLSELESGLRARDEAPRPSRSEPWGDRTSGDQVARSQTKRIEESRRLLLAALEGGQYSVSELACRMSWHARTIQRRLKELVAAGLVVQLGNGITPSYRLAAERG